MKVLLLLIFIAFSCTKKEPPVYTPPVQDDKPIVVTPETQESKELKLGKKYNLWSTYYFSPWIKSNPKAKYCLQDKNGSCISPKISHDQMCFFQMQGSGKIDENIYAYSSANSKRLPPSCKKYGGAYGGSHKVKFYINNKFKYGKGSFNNPLIPFKSIACPPQFANNKKLYIPKAKGVKLPDGTVHDGVFICHDRGGAIKGNKIDTFIGIVDMRENWKMSDWSRIWNYNPFKNHVKSSSSKTFEAYEVLN